MDIRDVKAPTVTREAAARHRSSAPAGTEHGWEQPVADGVTVAAGRLDAVGGDGAVIPASSTATPVATAAPLDDLLPDLIALRRDLHAHPELAFEERRTAGIVANALRLLGLEVQTGVGGTGVKVRVTVGGTGVGGTDVKVRVAVGGICVGVKVCVAVGGMRVGVKLGGSVGGGISVGLAVGATATGLPHCPCARV